MNQAITIDPKDLSQLSNKPVVVLPLADYERMQEDLEMLRSKWLAASIKQARADIAEGKGIAIEDAEAQLFGKK
ncbi:MAG: hypothetical protein ACR2FM_04185 [Candidatus Saccharimonadales bacterium]